MQQATTKRELTASTVAAIKGMVARGDRQWDVGVLYNMNSARINEIVHGKASGKRWVHVQPAPADKLPPPGPYVVVAQVHMDSVAAKALAHAAIVNELQALVLKFSANGPHDISAS